MRLLGIRKSQGRGNLIKGRGAMLIKEYINFVPRLIGYQVPLIPLGSAAPEASYDPKVAINLS